MFQSFDLAADPTVGAPRLKLLRAALGEQGLDGFLVPLADEHQGEYIAPSARRLAWLTGFAGSAGLAIVLPDEAAIFVDGRYTLQVGEQVDTAVFAPHHLIDEPPARWLAGKVEAGQRIGYDAWLHTIAEIERFERALKETGAALVPVASNPIDAAWSDRPAPPVGAVTLQAAAYAGEDAAQKLSRLAAALVEAKADAAVLTQPDSIAWTFNVRGADVAHNPVPLAFAILQADGRPALFIDGRKLSNAVRDQLEQAADVREPGEFTAALAHLGGRVLLDPKLAARAIRDAVVAGGATVVEGRDPVLLPKARKNAAELAGTREAHIRDGVAMARFLRWFDEEAPRGGLDEIAAATALERFRVATGALKDVSFDTIAGAGPHSAIPHYRVSTQSNLPIRPGELFLIDSGAQYEDGTTDITRTVAVGEPTAEMRDRFTRVLKGHIAIATLRFPKGAVGAQIDPFARHALWQAGLDYDHGTGHGVGVYLSVHEGPARIAKTGDVALQPGMILSNEPGYYKAGHWGIRTENLVVVEEVIDIAGAERPMLGFGTITLAPIDLRLVEPSLLTPGEREWLDAYHARVRATVGPRLEDEADRAWLAASTQPLADAL